MLRRCLLSLLVGLLFGSAFGATASAGDQQHDLDVIFLRWVPGTSPLALDPSLRGEPVLTAEEQKLLRQELDDVGSVVVTEMCRVGDGPERRRLLVVLRSPVEKEVPLRQLGPDDKDARYIQGPVLGKAWNVFPWSGSRDERVRLSPDPADPRRTLYAIDLVGGGQKSGVAVVWGK
jgi:hypothetical protein